MALKAKLKIARYVTFVKAFVIGFVFINEPEKAIYLNDGILTTSCHLICYEVAPSDFNISIRYSREFLRQKTMSIEHMKMIVRLI